MSPAERPRNADPKKRVVLDSRRYYRGIEKVVNIVWKTWADFYLLEGASP